MAAGRSWYGTKERMFQKRSRTSPRAIGGARSSSLSPAASSKDPGRWFGPAAVEMRQEKEGAARRGTGSSSNTGTLPPLPPPLPKLLSSSHVPSHQGDRWLRSPPTAGVTRIGRGPEIPRLPAAAGGGRKRDNGPAEWFAPQPVTGRLFVTHGHKRQGVPRPLPNPTHARHIGR